MDTHRKLKQHQTFAWRPKLDVNVLYTFNLRCALTRFCHFAEYLRYSVPLKVFSKPSQTSGEDLSPKITGFSVLLDYFRNKSHLMFD